MTREEYKEAMGIALEMRASEQIEVLMAKPLAVDVEASQGVTIAGPSASALYAAICQVQPTVVPPTQKGKDEEEIRITKIQTVTPPSTKRSVRLADVKREQVESPSKKRTKQMSSGPGKRRKTLQVVESDEF